MDDCNNGNLSLMYKYTASIFLNLLLYNFTKDMFMYLAQTLAE